MIFRKVYELNLIFVEYLSNIEQFCNFFYITFSIAMSQQEHKRYKKSEYFRGLISSVVMIKLTVGMLFETTDEGFAKKKKQVKARM